MIGITTASPGSLTDDTGTGATTPKGIIASAINSIGAGNFTVVLYSGGAAGIYSMSVPSASANLGTGGFTLEHIMTLTGVASGALGAGDFVAAGIDPIILDLDGDGYDSRR